MEGAEQVRVEESAGVIRIETRAWALLNRVLWTVIAAIIAGIAWPSLIASFVTGSGDVAFRVIFGITSIVSVLWIVVIWTSRSKITVTPDRIRWRIGSALFFRSHEVPLRDVERPELETRRTRSQSGGSTVTYIVHLRCRSGERRKLAVFRGPNSAAAQALSWRVNEQLLQQRRR